MENCTLAIRICRVALLNGPALLYFGHLNNNNCNANRTKTPVKVSTLVKTVEI